MRRRNGFQPPPAGTTITGNGQVGPGFALDPALTHDFMNNAAAASSSPGFAVAFTGSGGSGVVTTGMILLEAAAKAGLYGLMMRSAGPQIRGGESAAMLRFAESPVGCMGDRFDLLVGLDWLNVERFID